MGMPLQSVSTCTLGVRPRFRRSSFHRFTLRSFTLLSVALLAFTLLPDIARAQLTSAALTGSVRDDSGAAIPGATVTLISTTRGTNLVAVSNADGDFVFPTVDADTYNLRVTMEGFKTAERQNIVVHPGDRLSMGNLLIEVGALAETITVAARATELQTQSAERSYAVEGEAVKNIAVNGRSFFNLAFLTPGVVSTQNTGVPTGDAATMSANGQRTNSNNVQVDGITDMDTGNNGGPMVAVSLDSIQEIKVLTSNYQAEYGRSSGAQISAVTKSGGRDFHGSAYWFRRRDDLNANTWINNRNTPVTPTPVLNQRDLGYTVGGPVWLPGGLKGERTKVFFFFSQEFQKRLNPQTLPQRVRVPTDLERRGDFSQTRDNAGNLYPYIRDWQLAQANPTWGCGPTDQRACFADGGVLGRIPQNRLYDLGLNILKMYPQANSADTINQGFNYFTQEATSQPERQDLLRMDWNPSPSWRVTGKIINNKSDRLLPYGSFVLGSNLPDYSITYLFPRRGYSFTGASSLNNTTFLEVTYGYSHNAIDILPDQENPTEFTKSTLGLSAFPMIYPNAVQLDLPPRFQFGPANSGSRVANQPNLGTNNAPFTNFNTTQDVVASLTKLWGRHTAKVGVYYHHSLKPQSSFAPNNGDIEFTQDSSNPFDSQFPFANAALGVYKTYTQASGYFIGNYVYNNVEWYVQDNWKASDRLTLDYGLRFYWIQPQYDTEGQTANFLPDQWDANRAPRLYYPRLNAAGQKVGVDLATGQTVASQYIGRIVPNSGDLLNGVRQSGNGIEKGLYKNRGVHYAPRFGFTYDVTGAQSIIVRGGGGVFYDRAQGNTVFDLLRNPPVSLEPTFTYGRFQDIDPNNILLAPPALVAFDHDGKVPTTYAYNLGFQIKLPMESALDISYVGSLTRHQLQRVNVNAPAYGAAYLPQNQDPTAAPSTVPGQTALNVDFLRPYRGFGNISMISPSASSNYHSLQTAVNRRFKDGLLLGLSYTWSKALGTVSADLPNITGIGAPRPDQNQRAANYALLDFDRPHVFIANFVYELPRLKSTGVLARILNDWQTSGVYRLESGQPFTVTVNVPGISPYTLTGTQSLEAARPVINGDPGKGYSDDPYRMFNTSVFGPPQPGTLGFDSGKNYMRRAPTNNLDLSLAKRIPLGGVRRLEIRIDAFNALNHTQFLDLNTTLNVRSLTDPTPTNLPYDSNGNLVNRSGFGTVSNTRPPRTVQFLMRFQF
jgi:Carboxypeptidase regulatory-like domain/TonB-dependent Receptor Plug Domain